MGRAPVQRLYEAVREALPQTPEDPVNKLGRAVLVPLLSATASAATTLVPSAVAAQSVETHPPVLSEAEEIALARSAAPPNVSADATILVLREGRYETAVVGSSDVHCMVSRSQPLSLEPICYDPEASRTMLRIESRQVEMRLAGVSEEERERRIAESIGSGELALPRRPALAYMLSAGQILYADAETRVGAWNPHIHMYMPYATAEQFGGLTPGGASTGTAFVFDAGKPTANLVVIVKEFVEPEPSG